MTSRSKVPRTKSTDVMTREQRSRCMSQIRGKNTKIEIQLRKAVWSTGLRYRLHVKLPGTPDLAFSKSKVALFIDGCFWHGCPLHAVRPKSNRAFWQRKFAQNSARDKRVNRELKERGWKVLRCWEHDVEQNLKKVIGQIKKMTARR
jgi:DNA mismatch endonuclease (patch repair protein)